MKKREEVSLEAGCKSLNQASERDGGFGVGEGLLTLPPKKYDQPKRGAGDLAPAHQGEE